MVNGETCGDDGGGYGECVAEVWDLLGLQVMTIFEEFWKGTCAMERINSAHLFLTPKCQGAERV